MKDVLARMRESLGVLGGPGVVVSGEATRFGARGAYRVRADGAGRFAQSFEGELPESSGFDGARGWAVDWTGMPRSLELADLETAQLFACAQAGAWFAPGSPFALSVAEPPADGVARVTAAHRRGRLRAELLVEVKTGLPSALRVNGPLGNELLTFDGWQAGEGVLIPGCIESRSGDVVSAFYEVADVRSAEEEVDSAFGVGAEPPEDVSFAVDAPPEVALARGVTGHVLARVQLGDETGWFVIDTGAGGSTALDAATAARLAVGALGSTSVGSVEGIVRAPILRVPPLTIGPLTLERPLVVAMDLDFLAGIFDEPIVGIIGYDLFSRCVAEFQLGSESLRLHDPRGYELAEGSWQELRLHMRHPVVPARYENSRHGLFRVDVGAAGGALANVVFHTPTVEAERLLDDRDYEGIRVGVHDVALGPLLWFELDGERFHRPVAAFSRDHKGPFADGWINGNLGVGFLSRFRLTLDYARRRFALVKVGA